MRAVNSLASLKTIDLPIMEIETDTVVAVLDQTRETEGTMAHVGTVRDRGKKCSLRKKKLGAVCNIPYRMMRTFPSPFHCVGFNHFTAYLYDLTIV